MRIIIAIDNFRIGGAERVASLIANHLANSNEVHVLLFDDVIRYDISDKVIMHKIDLKAPTNRAFRFIYRIKMYLRLFKEINPDVVYSFGYVGIYAVLTNKLLINNIKSVICSERTDPRREPKNAIIKILRDWAYNNCSILVCQTDEVVEYFKNKGMKVDYAVIPNPVKSGLPNWNGKDSRTFITACRLEPQKNLDLMIDGFTEFSKHFQGYKLDIYGDGYLIDYLKRKIGDLCMNDIISIYPFNTDIHSIMANSLAYVSTSDYEGISNSMLEALAIGMPTICTDCPVGGARMFIQNGVNGYLFEVGNKQSFVNTLINFIQNSNINYISERAKEISEILAPEKIVAQWIKLIKKPQK